MRTATITVAVTVSNVPDHVTDQQILDRLRSLVPAYSLSWPEPRSFIASATLVEASPTEPVKTTEV